MPNSPRTARPRKSRARDPRPSSSRRGYDRHWQALRLLVLSEEPVCQDCGREMATQVDHVVSLERGGTHDRENLRALCASCHSKKTVRVDGGFGR